MATSPQEKLIATPAEGRTAQQSPLRWVIVGLLSLGMIIAYVDRANLSVVLVVPEFKRVFSLTEADRGVLNSAFFWFYAFLQIPAGWVVDRYGVKFPYAIGFFVWSLLSASTAWCTSLSQLLTVRALIGVSEAIVLPASMRWIRFNFAEKQRGLAIGLLMTGTKIGPAIAAPLTAALIAMYDWRAMFVLVGIGSMLWLVPWLSLVRNNDREIERQASAASPSAGIPFSTLMASPVIWGTVIGTFCYMYFVYFCMTWMPAYLVERRNLSLTSMGAYTFFSFGGMATVAALAGWAADRMIAAGRNAVTVRKGFTIAGLLMASTEVIGAFSDSVSVALFFAVFSLSGLGLATANYWALTQTLIPGASIGKIVGIQNCAANLPGIVAPILTGWLKQTTGSYEGPMQAIWIFLLIGVAAYLFLVREKYVPVVRAPAGQPVT